MVPWRTWVGLMIVAVLSGCGTVKNLHPPSESIVGDPVKRVFGGVRDNCENIKYRLDTSKPQMLPQVAIAIHAIDLPLCIIGDTITLPYTLAYDRQWFGCRIICEPGYPTDAVLSALPRSLEQDSPREKEKDQWAVPQPSP